MSMTKLLSPTDVESAHPQEMVGRFIENPFGVKEVVVLKQIWWEYFDWLDGKGFKTAALIRHCYKRKPHLSLSEALTWLLWHIAWHRQNNGKLQPRWIEAAPPPAGYEHF